MAHAKRTRKQWQRLVSQWESSGLSAKAYAAKRSNLNPKTLTWWRSKFRRDERETTGSASAPEFLPVVIQSTVPPVERVAERFPVEIVLVNGVRLHFEHQLDQAGLGVLATAFGGAS